MEQSFSSFGNTFIFIWGRVHIAQHFIHTYTMHIFVYEKKYFPRNSPGNILCISTIIIHKVNSRVFICFYAVFLLNSAGNYSSINIQQITNGIHSAAIVPFEMIVVLPGSCGMKWFLENPICLFNNDQWLWKSSSRMEQHSGRSH